MLQHHHHQQHSTSHSVNTGLGTTTHTSSSQGQDSDSSTPTSCAKVRRKPLELLTGIFCKKAKNHNNDEVCQESSEDSEVSEEEPDYPEPREALHSPYHARTIDQDMEALRLSRQDNPYLQILTSQEYLNDDSEYEDKHFLMSKENVSSSASNSSSRDPLTMAEVHARLVRSPPPIMWTRNTRSTADFFQFPPANTLSPRIRSAGSGSHFEDVAGKLNLSPGEGFLRRVK